MAERDRFGDKLKEKERADEDRFFAERDRQLLEKLRGQKAEESEASIRQLAQGRCPKCGQRLHPKKVEQVEIDECEGCQGVWLDKGELETLSQRDAQGWIGRLLGR